MILQAKAVVSLGSIALLAQIAPSSPVVPGLDSLGRLTLDGALIIAVGVLWRALASMGATKDARIAEKDLQLIAMTTKVTEVMVMVIETNKELRQSNDEIGQAMDNLASNIAALPCARDEQVAARAEKQDAARRHGAVRPTL